MNVDIPELCLVVLVGPSASGKTSFARRHFLPTEVVSSDHCRALLCDDPNDQSATAEAFELLHHLVSRRLKRGRLTVVDATSVQASARRALVAIARAQHVECVAIVFDLPLEVLLARHALRRDRPFGQDVIRTHWQEMRRSLNGIKSEGFRAVHVLADADAIDTVSLVREPSASNLRHERGPFDIIGDVHGCYEELGALLARLGYRSGEAPWSLRHPEGRKLIFVGDLVDRGPRVPEVVRLVQGLVAAGVAYCVAGNHDDKLARALRGRKVTVAHGLAQSLEQLAAESEETRLSVAAFLEQLASHYVLDRGRLVVAHAGLPEHLHGRSSARVRAFTLYGETTGEVDAFGLPVRVHWAQDYRGQATVVYGHTPVREPEWVNNTLCIDTGCVFGGRLTALRYPERDLVSEPARREYYAPIHPLGAVGC